MSEGRPQESPWTWTLGAVFVLLFTAALTQPPFLWRPLQVERTRELGRLVAGQTYAAARKIYTAPDDRRKVFLLGDSRIRILPEREARLMRALAERGLPHVEVRNLGIFGATISDVEVLLRHLAAARPDVVVLAIDGLTLLPSPLSELRNVPSRTLDIGWRDGPLPAAGWLERAQRWLRTAWPLFRFREFVRLSLYDGLDRERPPELPLTRLTPRQLFEYVHGERAGAVEQAYLAYLLDPTLATLTRYLEVERKPYVDWMRARAALRQPLAADAPAARVLAALCERLPVGARTVFLLPPRNPLLREQDTAAELWRPQAQAAADELVRRTAERCGARVVDGSEWLPATDFLDYDHPLPDTPRLEEHLTREIAHALAG